MSNVSGKQYGVGARYCCVYELNANGSPNATGATTAYTGVQSVGLKAFDLTIPEPVKITHMGDDRPLQIDYLPPTEAASGEVRVAQENQDLYALFQGVAKVTVGEATMVGLGTSEQGTEPQVGLLMYQQSLDDAGVRNWRWFLLPKATIYVAPGSLNENPSEHRYVVAPQVVNAHLWETAFSEVNDGFTTAQLLVGQSRYRPMIAAWLATTGTTSFSLPVGIVAADTNKMAIWVDGVAQTSGVTKGTTQLVFQTAPGNNKRVFCFYERL